MCLLLGSRQSILSSLPLLMVNAVGIETTIVAGRAARRYHRCHGAEHCRDAVPCREAPRAQEAACSRSRGGQRMPPKSLSAKSKASVALSGYFDFLKWGSQSEAAWAQTSQSISSGKRFWLPQPDGPFQSRSIQPKQALSPYLKNWERLHCIASLKFVVSNFCIEAYQPRLKRHTETKKAAAGWDWRRLFCEFLI